MIVIGFEEIHYNVYVEGEDDGGGGDECFERGKKKGKKGKKGTVDYFSHHAPCRAGKMPLQNRQICSGRYKSDAGLFCTMDRWNDGPKEICGAVE